MSTDHETCFYNDNAAEKDSLGFKPYVEAIAEFLTDEKTKPPITLSIEGHWGCGKSSFMCQLRKHIEILNESVVEKTEHNNQSENKNKYERIKDRFLDSLFRRKKYFTLWFNCWTFEKENELWAAFALNLMDQLSAQLPFILLLWAQLKLRALRLEFKWKNKSLFYLNISIFIFFIFICIAFSFPALINVLSLLSTDKSIVNLIKVFTIIIGPILPILYIGKDIKDVIRNPFDFKFNKFVSNQNYAEHISFLQRFHSDFKKIIKSYAGDSRVYVFVDDLDRCEVPKAAELMQAINLMISDNDSTSSEKVKIYCVYSATSVSNFFFL